MTAILDQIVEDTINPATEACSPCGEDCARPRSDAGNIDAPAQSHAPTPGLDPAPAHFGLTGMVSLVRSDRIENNCDVELGHGRLSAPVGVEREKAAVVPHESPVSPPSVGPVPSPGVPVARAASTTEASSKRFAKKQILWQKYQDLAAQGFSQAQAARKLGVSNATLSRMDKAVREAKAEGVTDPTEALADNYDRCGRKPKLILTEAEQREIQSIYLATERNAEEGSMRHACRVFANRETTREEIRTVFLSALERGVLPPFAVKILRQVTRAHFAARRKPGMLGADHFAGTIGAFADDKINRRRVVESDDGTLNIVAWIPWPHGGDPVSDKFGVRLGRWQFLPAMEAGWSQYYLGYSFIARNRGSYRTEDVLKVINMVATDHGLPDAFRFERGTWESNRVLELLETIGVELKTGYQSNHKPHIEGGFNKIWTPMSVMPGNVGRYRGAFEEENKDVQRCRAGRADPRDLFPAFKDVIAALDHTLADLNTTRIHSKVYGSWVPEVRYREHKAERPWPALPQSVRYLFAPFMSEWTVRKGSVSGKVKLTEDISLPVCFRNDELWRSEGHMVRLYFDIAADPCIATVVASDKHLCYKPGDVIGEATLQGDIPNFIRAALGWADPTAPTATSPSQRGPLSAVRRETRSLAPGGGIISSTSEERDGRGSNNIITRGSVARAASTLECGGKRSATPLSRAPETPSTGRSNRAARISSTEDLTATTRIDYDLPLRVSHSVAKQARPASTAASTEDCETISTRPVTQAEPEEIEIL